MLTISPEIIQHIKDGGDYCHLIELQLEPVPIYLTDCVFDVVSDVKTFLGNGILNEIDSVAIRSEITVNQTKINFTAVEQSMVSFLLNNNPINRVGKIGRAYLRPDGTVLGILPLTRLQVINYPDIEAGTTSAEVSLSIAGIFADFEKITNRRSTNKSQQNHFPLCTGHDFAAEAGKEYRWGRKS